MPMNGIKQFASRISRMISGKLANRLILILLPLVTVFIVLLILISYIRTTETLKNDFVENNKSILKLVIQNFDSAFTYPWATG